MIGQVAECVSFILLKDGKVLLEKRSLKKETDPGLVAIPGGHIEPGETAEEALTRELDEELGINPIQIQFLCKLYHPTQELQLISYYTVTKWTGDIKCNEAEVVFWADGNQQRTIGIVSDQLALNEFARLRAVLTDETY